MFLWFFFCAQLSSTTLTSHCIHTFILILAPFTLHSHSIVFTHSLYSHTLSLLSLSHYQIGMLDGQTVRFVSGAKFGLGYREQFVETHQLTTTSHSRLLSQVATDEKGLADYFIIKKEGSMFHHLMDITADGVYMDRDALQSLFFPSYSAQRKKTFPFKE